MKCTVCRQKADYNSLRHNAHFCREHFLQHFYKQIEKAIDKFKMFSKEDKILLAVSGGKDSMTLWHILQKLDYQIVPVFLDMGLGSFSLISEARVMGFAEKHQTSVQIIRFADIMDCSFEKARKLSARPACALCGSVKRYFINQLAREYGCSVIATGHNLDDEACFLFGNTINWEMSYLKRKGPVLPGEEGLVKKVKPLIRVTDEETKIYTRIQEIDVIEAECPNVPGSKSHHYKEVLSELEKKYPVIKSHFYFGFLKKILPSITEEKEKIVLTDKDFCPSCGYKTLKKGNCFVCDLKEKIKQSK